MEGCKGAIGGIQYLGEGEYLREFPGKSRLLKRFQGFTRRGTTHAQVTVHRVSGPLCELGKSDAIGALVIYPFDTRVTSGRLKSVAGEEVRV